MRHFALTCGIWGGLWVTLVCRTRVFELDQKFTASPSWNNSRGAGSGQGAPSDPKAAQQLEELANENRAIRAELQKLARRLEANEALGARLKQRIVS